MKENTLTGKLLASFGAAALLAGSAAYAGPISQPFKEPAPVIIEEEAPVWGADLAFGWDSEYIFRGVKQIDGSLVWTDLSFYAYGFTVGAWFGEALTDDFNELNVYVAYTYNFDDMVDLTGGYIFYHFPKSGSESTHELFVGVDVVGLDFVTPSLYYFHDLDLADGGYLEGALSSSFEVVPGILSLDPYVLLAVSFKYNSDVNDWNHFQYGIEAPISLSENITLTGFFSGTVPMSAISSFETNRYWAGANITFSF